MKDKLKVLDLFSGIGGFSLGLERAGMETVAFCEQDEHCQRVLKKHWPKVPIFEDIKNLKAKHLPSDIFLVAGGFPCQDVSVAGNKKGFKDELGQKTRSGLWEEFKRIIKEAEPRYAIIENVANLRNLGLNQVIKDLWSIGYACEWHIISARSIGACHLRERIWIIAYSDSTNLRKQPRRGSGETSNPDMPRLWKPFASEKESSRWWAKATTSLRDWWKVESAICRVDDGLPRGLDKGRKERVKQLGNTVLPQIPELIGRAIMEYEKGQQYEREN